MSRVEKSDAKNHLSPQYQTELHLNPPLSQPDATGFSVEEPAPADWNVEEQHQQASFSGLEASPLSASQDSSSTVAPTISKSAQA